MRRGWIVLLLVVAATLQAAEKQKALTVDQLCALVESQSSAHVKDSSLAEQLRKVTLTERLPSWQAVALQTKYRLGAKTIKELNLLADESAFLVLPVSAQPQMPVPAKDVLQALWNNAIHVEASTLEHLPNFLASRETHVYSNVPEGSSPIFEMHAERVFSHEITYRNGAEVPFENRYKVKQEELQGLVTTGEFGPMLKLVLLDLPEGKLRWSHWEQMPAGPAVVLQYEVPRAHAHFSMRLSCCATHTMYDQYLREVQYARTSAYHGEIAIDPATGSVLRLTVIPEFEAKDLIESAGIAIDYDWRMIGDKRHLCPVHSVAHFSIDVERILLPILAGQSNLSLAGMQQRQFEDAQQRLAGVHLYWINSVEFKNYRHFESSFRLLPVNE